MDKQTLIEEKQMVKDLESRKSSLSKNELEELLRLKCRTDFLTYAKFITSGVFKPFPVHRVICDFIQKIADGEPEYRRTVISLPPRTGKSLLISKIFPSWQMGRSPLAQFIMSSYAMGLSQENSRSVLNYIKSDKFKWVFPECDIDSDKCNLTTIRNLNGGLIKVASAGGNVTGFGFGSITNEELPGIGILDDLLADGNSETIMESTFAWVQTQFLTRALPNNAIISMGTRFHKDDVTGRLISAAPEEWKILNVPALCTDEETDPLNRKLGESHWPEFFPVAALNVIRKNIGEKDFEALYQGNPITMGGAIFKHHWIQTYSYDHNSDQRYSYTYMTVDTACKDKTKNDYTSVCVWGYSKQNNEIHLIDVILDRFDFPDLLKEIKTYISLYRVRSIYIESVQTGAALAQTLKKTLNISVKELIPNKDKVLRANSIAPLVEAGYVRINENITNYEERIAELTSFPYIRRDDFIDAFVYGVMVLRDDIGIGVKTTIKTSDPKPQINTSSDFTPIETKTQNVLTPKVSRIFTTQNSGSRAFSGLKYR